MGAWGVKLYQDDITIEVKDYYIDRLKRGAKDDELTQEMFQTFKEYIDDVDDSGLFWFALADVQWDYGRLEEFVRENALYHIRLGHDLSKWTDPDKYSNRKKVLSELEIKLQMNQPKIKKVLGYRFYRCDWNIGDVFAIKFESEESKISNSFGKYMIFQKVDNTIAYPGHTVPVVRVFKWMGDILPKIDIIHELTVMPSFFKPAVYVKNYSKQRGQRRKTILYNMSIDYTAKRFVHKNLVYLGNSLPIRILDRIDSDTRNIYWKHLEDELLRTYSSWKDFNVYDLLDEKIISIEKDS